MTKSIKLLSKRNEAILAVVVILVLVAPVSVYALSRPDQKMPTKSTATKSKKKDQKKIAAANTQTGQPPTENQSQANNQPKPTTAPKPAPAPGNPSPSSKFPPKRPTTNPTHSMPLVYSVSINKTTFTQVAPDQFDIPITFTVHQGRFNHATFGADIIASPPFAYGVVCNARTLIGGSVRVYLPQQNPAPNGQYTCQLTVNADGSVKTDQFTFTITEGVFSLP